MDNPHVVRLTLVSASPRRQELLQKLGHPFEIQPTAATELSSGHPPLLLAQENARRKVAASPFYGDPARLLIGADTIVVLGAEIFGKPETADDARRMLEALSGRIHQVITGLYLSGPGDRTPGPWVHLPAAETTFVRFRELSPADIQSYLASDEWEGKAGAYAIQATGRGLVASYDGDFDNVVGLPVTLLHGLLTKSFSHCRFL